MLRADRRHRRRGEDASTAARNAEASPLRYNLDPQDQFRIMTEMEERGEELAAIYHSHTASPAYPSQTDINLAAYPDALYLIVSLAEGEEPLRGFRSRRRGRARSSVEVT